MVRTIFSLLLLALLVSCSPVVDFKAIIPEHVDTFATGFIDDVKDGHIEECLTQVTPEMNNQGGRDYLTNAFNNFKRLQVDSFRIINASKTILMGQNGYANYTIDYEYFIEDKFLYFSFGIHEELNKLTITAFDGRIFDTSLTEIHAFTFKDKGFIHYVFALFGVLVPIFIVVTLISAIRTKMNKKWLWIIGILFGVVKYSLNWTTGQVGVQLISIQIFGAGLTKSGLVAPWTLAFSLPLVGMYFWVKKYLDKRDSELLADFAEEVKKREAKG